MSKAQASETTISWSLLKRYWRLVIPYWQSDKKKQAWWLLSLMVLFICLLAFVNAYKTYISKWAIDALTNKDKRQFYQVIALAVVSLAFSVPIEALAQYYRQKLGLFWRKWFNLTLLGKYFKQAAYYKMSLYSAVDNPDQRIAEDLNNFVTNSSNFYSTLFFSVISLLTYIGVLGSISLMLVVIVLLYATAGTSVIIWLSKKLVLLNFNNIKLQANYRYNLVHVRDNIESIAFYQGEKHESSVLRQAFKKLIENYRHLIILQRNISFFSHGYILFSALIPFVVLAPVMFAGKIEIGTVVQASTVFAILLQDLSIFVNEFQTLSNLAATTQRLSGFMAGLNAKAPDSKKITSKVNQHFAFDNVTVRTPDLKKTLVRDLTLTLPTGRGVMIVGPSGSGKSSLLRAVATLWENGQGLLVTPKREDIMFLPQKPYMLLGTLREQLIYPHLDSEISDEVLETALETVNLHDLVSRVGGLDVTMKWSDLLSLGEQQRLIFLRLLLTKPPFAILDESTSALDEANEAQVYQSLRESGTTYISVGHRSSLIDFHDNILALDGQEGWTLYSQEEYTQATWKC